MIETTRRLLAVHLTFY